MPMRRKPPWFVARQDRGKSARDFFGKLEGGADGPKQEHMHTIYRGEGVCVWVFGVFYIKQTFWSWHPLYEGIVFANVAINSI